MAKKGRKDDLKRNGEGYYDPTPYKAMRGSAPTYDEINRFRKLLDTFNYIADIAGFEICGRIHLKDNETGRIWR